MKEFAPDGSTLVYSGAHFYDLAGQLTGESVAPAVSPVVTSTVQTFDADNRLLAHNGATASFDADGNLLSIASGVSPASYTYDARNRLTSAGGFTYTYDAENHRIASTTTAGATRFAVNPAGNNVLVRTAPDGTKTFYVYGLGLLHEQTGSTLRYYHFDRRGDTVVLTDASGTVTDRAGYGVYGELLTRTGSTVTPFLFNGQWGVQTEANGLYYHRARYYHPGLRRFLNQDTVLGEITRAASLNRFAYANGNPVSAIDPFGTMAIDFTPPNLSAMFAAFLAPNNPGDSPAEGAQGGGASTTSSTVQQPWTVGPLVTQNSPNNTIVTDGQGGLVVWHSPTEVNALRGVLAPQVFNVYYQGVEIHELTHISQALAAGVDGLANAGAGHILYMPPGTTNAFEAAAYAPQIAYLTQQVSRQQQFISQNGTSTYNTRVLNQLNILLNQTTRNRDSYHTP